MALRPRWLLGQTRLAVDAPLLNEMSDGILLDSGRCVCFGNLEFELRETG